jgi:gas vesicle protein
MGQDPEQLTTTPAEIEATRSNLSRDIDELTDKVSPARVMDRRKAATRSRIGSLRDKVMGSAGNAKDALGGTASGGSGAAAGTTSGAISGLEARTQGNPLAAGVVAFGAGMLISALIPASERESRAARKVADLAQDEGQPLVDEAKSVGQEMATNLKESAGESARRVQATAQDSVETVKQEGQSSAQTVKDDATPH